MSFKMLIVPAALAAERYKQDLADIHMYIKQRFYPTMGSYMGSSNHVKMLML